MSKKLSPEAEAMLGVIRRCVDAVPLRPVSTSLKDLPETVMMPVRSKKQSPPRKKHNRKKKER